MTWVKLDDGYSMHPKLVGASDSAFRLDVAGLCWSAAQLTNGRIPEAVLPVLGVKRWKPAVAELVACGRWEVEGCDYQIHDFLDYQESREKVHERRAKTADRVAQHRARNAVTPPVTNADGNGGGNAAPVPSRPDLVATDVATTAVALVEPRYPEAFETWWLSYPARFRKGKGDAAKAWARERKAVGEARLLGAVKDHAAAWERIGETFVPNPSTWLNQKRYDDPTPEPRPVNGGKVGVSRERIRARAATYEVGP